MPFSCEPIAACRACGKTELLPCVDLGAQYLSSVFPDSDAYRDVLRPLPLALVRCAAGCGLVQLQHRIELSAMYATYPYSSAANASMREILKDVALSGKGLATLRRGDVVLDIGGNDGTLLSNFIGQGFALLNIDASLNIASCDGVEQVRGAFSQSLFASASARKARLIFSVAMFYHLDDPVAFCRDVAACLEHDGAWIIQMAYLPAMLATTGYDNIVHEHQAYYGLGTLSWVLGQAGLEMFHAETNDVYGGSVRVFVKHRDYPLASTDSLIDLVQFERLAHLDQQQTYHEFQARIESTKATLQRFLATLAAHGNTVWIYGASTKGNTISQHCGLTTATVQAAADVSPFKIGKRLIGCDIPIYSEDAMREAQPDYLLALPYSFYEAFMRREAQLADAGTRFIVPLPEVAVYGAV